MGVGIGDVARRAGVSTATVSRALRGLPNVSDDARRRVLAAALELDYVVSPSASSLASGRMAAIGVVAPSVARWFFGQVVGAAEDAFRRAGYTLMLYLVEDQERRRRLFTDLPMRRRVDGLVVVSLPLDRTETDAVHRLGIPVVQVGSVRSGSVERFASVRIDDIAGARVAVDHLIALGHAEIGMIAGGLQERLDFTAPEDRRTGYRHALAAAGLPVDPALDVEGGYTVAGGEQAMAQLLARPRPPTAVFAQSDEMAMGALTTIRAAGLRCPDDVSVIGFDDHEMARLFDLTTVAQPVHEQGELAAAQMLAMIAGAPAGEPVVLPTRLVVRGTTGPPARRSVAKPPRTAAG